MCHLRPSAIGLPRAQRVPPNPRRTETMQKTSDDDHATKHPHDKFACMGLMTSYPVICKCAMGPFMNNNLKQWMICAICSAMPAESPTSSKLARRIKRCNMLSKQDAHSTANSIKQSKISQFNKFKLCHRHPQMITDSVKPRCQASCPLCSSTRPL